ncbi:MAG: hypothetical protein ACE5E7_11985 [Anaerolineae bacterium]
MTKRKFALLLLILLALGACTAAGQDETAAGTDAGPTVVVYRPPS